MHCYHNVCVNRSIGSDICVDLLPDHISCCMVTLLSLKYISNGLDGSMNCLALEAVRSLFRARLLLVHIP